MDFGSAPTASLPSRTRLAPNAESVTLRLDGEPCQLCYHWDFETWQRNEELLDEEAAEETDEEAAEALDG